MVVRGAEKRARAAVISRALTTFMPWENYNKKKKKEKKKDRDNQGQNVSLQQRIHEQELHVQNQRYGIRQRIQ